MVKILDSGELAGFIKERQAHDVRRLRQAAQIQPRLALVQIEADSAEKSFLQSVQEYGADISVEIEVHTVTEVEAPERLEELNSEPKVQGIAIVGSVQTELRQKVSVAKDVAGQAKNSTFDTPLAVAINWLLAGYNINLPGKLIVVVGESLEGELLAKMWRNSELDVTVVHENDEVLIQAIREADVIVCNSEQPNLITRDMVKPEVIIVEASRGQSCLDETVYQLPNITITPENEGVEPLKICALFDNLLRFARVQL